MIGTSPALSIATEYPRFKSAGGFLGAPESLIGSFRPFGRSNGAEFEDLIDDLRVGARVFVSAGTIVHDPYCGRRHEHVDFINKLSGVERETFAVRIAIWQPPAHPKAIALYPEISAVSFPNHPHLFRHAAKPLPELKTLDPALFRRLSFLAECDSSLPDALCTYRASDGEWSGDVVEFLDYTALFLAKHVIWVRTGGDLRASWIGPQRSHNPNHLVTEITPNQECWCGAGRRYGKCHRDDDLRRAKLTSMKPARVSDEILKRSAA